MCRLPTLTMSQTRPVRLAAGCETLILAAWVRFPYGSLIRKDYPTGDGGRLLTGCASRP